MCFINFLSIFSFEKKNEILWSLKLANCRNNQSFLGYTENKLHELKTKKISSNTSNTIKEIHKKHLLPRVQWVLNDNVFWKVGGKCGRSLWSNQSTFEIYIFIYQPQFFFSNECLIYTCKGLLALLVSNLQGWCRDGSSNTEKGVPNDENQY